MAECWSTERRHLAPSNTYSYVHIYIQYTYIQKMEKARTVTYRGYTTSLSLNYVSFTLINLRIVGEKLGGATMVGLGY